MRLTMLGTGNALVTECYNTCFVLNEKDRYLLVDGGGGSALLGQLKHSGIDWKDIKEIFVTHKHIDHGFTMYLEDGEKLTCCGDEPYNDYERQYVENSKWLMHEAFCLYSQADIFHPYEKHHSTVREACQLAEQLGVKNLLLYHTEDKNIKKRKELYEAEGSQYFRGKLYVPDDLEQIEI